jgi:regulator of sigma E protease
MSESRNRSFTRLGIIAGIILLAILLGYLTENLPLILDILGAIGLVLIGITILVTIHELGHFLTAKAFGMRVETFSIGFPPKIFGFTKGETEYQFGATPLGGYVKITGIIDESLDTQHLNEKPKPYEFRAKPVWQRLIVMTGGVIMNIILGIVVFSMLKYTYGDFFLPMSEVKYGIKVADPRTVATEEGDSVYVQSLGYFLGFRTGDELVSYKGQAFENFDDYINQKNLLEDDAYYEVRRNGELTRIEVPGNVQNYFSSDTISSTLFGPAFPPLIHVEETMDTDGDPKTPGISSPAYVSGLRTGDIITMMDSIEVKRFSDIGQITRGKAGDSITVVVERDGSPIAMQVQISPEGYLGVYGLNLTETFTFDTLTYGFFESFKPGTREAFTFLFANVQGIANLSREGVDAGKSVMGPIQIASVYLKAFKEGGVRKFMELTAMLSMILAFVNILPIPALDGGHVVFLLIEAITRKEPSAKVRIIAQQIGMIFILSLMLVIIFNDFFRLIS